MYTTLRCLDSDKESEIIKAVFPYFPVVWKDRNVVEYGIPSKGDYIELMLEFDHHGLNDGPA